MSNFTLNIHRVTKVTLSPAKDNNLSTSAYETRTIEIESHEGTFEITLFSEHVSLDEDAAAMIVVNV